jgi:hypothetical protein
VVSYGARLAGIERTIAERGARWTAFVFTPAEQARGLVAFALREGLIDPADEEAAVAEATAWLMDEARARGWIPPEEAEAEPGARAAQGAPVAAPASATGSRCGPQPAGRQNGCIAVGASGGAPERPVPEAGIDAGAF